MKDFALFEIHTSSRYHSTAVTRVRHFSSQTTELNKTEDGSNPQCRVNRVCLRLEPIISWVSYVFNFCLLVLIL